MNSQGKLISTHVEWKVSNGSKNIASVDAGSMTPEVVQLCHYKHPKNKTD